MFFYFLKTNKHCQDGIQTGCGGLKDLRVQVVVLQNKLQTVENKQAEQSRTELQR